MENKEHTLDEVDPLVQDAIDEELDNLFDEEPSSDIDTASAEDAMVSALDNINTLKRYANDLPSSSAAEAKRILHYLSLIEITVKTER